MTPQELQDKIDYLIDIEKNIFFSLQDKNLGQAVKKANSVFFPMEGRKFIENQTIIRQQLVPYVYNNPKKYILYYGRTPRYHNADHLQIDTRDNDTLIPNNDTLQDMDNRNDNQRREDELTLRETKTLIGELRGEIKYLREKNDDLQEKIEELREDLEDEQAGNNHAQMADATTSTIGQVVPVMMQMAEKYFSLQQQKNDLLAEQLRRRAPQQPQNPNLNNQQTTNETYYETEN